MTMIELRPELVKRLERIAVLENRTLDSTIETLLNTYEIRQVESQPDENTESHTQNPMAGLLGFLAGRTQATDLSITIHETMDASVGSGYGFSLKDEDDSH